jgi:hypothetical protein
MWNRSSLANDNSALSMITNSAFRLRYTIQRRSLISRGKDNMTKTATYEAFWVACRVRCSATDPDLMGQRTTAMLPASSSHEP